MRASWCLLATASLAAAQPAPRDAVRGIVRAIDRYPAVINGESHWLQQAGAFYISLARDPAAFTLRGRMTTLSKL